MNKESIIGSWPIHEMGNWDEDYIHMEEEASIQFKSNNLGNLNFGLIKAQLEYIIDQETQRGEFTFDGVDENDEVFGRGYVKVLRQTLEVKIFLHMSEQSTFKTKKKKS